MYVGQLITCITSKMFITLQNNQSKQVTSDTYVLGTCSYLFMHLTVVFQLEIANL